MGGKHEAMIANGRIITRLRRFTENAGIWGGIRLVLIVVVMFLIISPDSASSTWLYTIPTLIIAFTVTYPMRDLLVRHVHAVARGLNILVFLGLAGAFLARGTMFANAWWMSVLVVAFVGGYLGTEFWLLSDPRIMVER